MTVLKIRTSPSPSVSVIMTVYEAGGHLQQALDSVINQSFTDWELLVMDDGSTDPLVHSTLDAIVDPRVTVCRYSPSEADRAFSCRYATLINRAVRYSTGKYVTYLCGDDFYMPDRLERMVAVLEQGHDVLYGSQMMIREDGSVLGRRPADLVLADAAFAVDLNSVMHTRESFNEVGGWDESPEWRHADARFWRRLTGAGYMFVPVLGDPTDTKRYREQSVDARVIRGETPWIP
jgi:glycosyltransferase involved in cell wall biosynthesis